MIVETAIRVQNVLTCMGLQPNGNSRTWTVELDCPSNPASCLHSCAVIFTWGRRNRGHSPHRILNRPSYHLLQILGLRQCLLSTLVLQISVCAWEIWYISWTI